MDKAGLEMATDQSTTEQSHLVRLAKHISQGQVVFFIGAGFSLDSENNSAAILIARLVARFEALCQLTQENNEIAVKTKQEFAELYYKLKQQFNLKPKKCPLLTEDNIEKLKKCPIFTADNIKQLKKCPICTTDNIEQLKKCPIFTTDNIKQLKKSSICTTDYIDKLTNDYYLINDWFCSAFAQMLQGDKLFRETPQDKQCLIDSEALNQRELAILSPYLANPSKDAEVTKHLQAVDLTDYLVLTEKQRGKALFLDTMGFNNSQIMRHYPEHKDKVNSNNDQQHSAPPQTLFPRHHILGQWAKEGVMPILVTSNYDLLLEGGYIGVGNAVNNELSDEANNTRVSNQPRFATVSQPNEFFVRGHGFQQSLIVKIHGCAASYRRYREESLSKNPKQSQRHQVCSWEKYLTSMVFTYREIQNWRADKWSQEYLQTLLRTRKMVFMGYSGQDPVIHDTIRSVYEDIAKQRQLTPNPNPNPNPSEIDIPSYFFEPGGSSSFHATEILRSAQHAVSDELACVLTETNKFTFHYKNKQHLPDLDHKLRMLFHLSYRELQLKLFPQYLPRVLLQLFGKHKPSQQQHNLIKALQDFCGAEQRQLVEFRESIIKKFSEVQRECRENSKENASEIQREFREQERQLNQHLAWTESFHQPLMNMLYDAEQRHAQRGNTSTAKPLNQAKNLHWYTPITTNPEWSAWCIVIECALRNINNAFKNHHDAKSERDMIQPLTRVIPTENNRYQALHTQYGLDPTLVIMQPKYRSPSYVHFRIGNTARTRQPLPHTGVHADKSRMFWDLAIDAIPWQRHQPNAAMAANKQNQANTPSAEQLWQLATNQPSSDSLASLQNILPIVTPFTLFAQPRQQEIS